MWFQIQCKFWIVKFEAIERNLFILPSPLLFDHSALQGRMPKHFNKLLSLKTSTRHPLSSYRFPGGEMRTSSWCYKTPFCPFPPPPKEVCWKKHCICFGLLSSFPPFSHFKITVICLRYRSYRNLVFKSRETLLMV